MESFWVGFEFAVVMSAVTGGFVFIGATATLISEYWDPLMGIMSMFVMLFVYAVGTRFGVLEAVAVLSVGVLVFTSLYRYGLFRPEKGGDI